MPTLTRRTTVAEQPAARSVQLGPVPHDSAPGRQLGYLLRLQGLLIDERGVLFTGPSGSGKSTLMDAHSAALLPSRDQRFNASADITARAPSRAPAAPHYVRGAWSENDDEHEQSQVQYLRGGKPTWSAIGVTYETGSAR